jgi:hypothetical protein
MLIYTGDTGVIKKLDQIRDLDVRVLLSPRSKNFVKNIPCALDNGAWGAHKNGFGFNEYAFLWLIHTVIRREMIPDFVVCPDIVEGSWASLDFSEMWRPRLPGFKLYLAVQDGMVPGDRIKEIIENYAGIFVGGSKDWKFKTAPDWINFAHSLGKMGHIGGRINTVQKLQWAEEIGADSIDSTLFTRKNKIDRIANAKKQGRLDLVHL